MISTKYANEYYFSKQKQMKGGAYRMSIREIEKVANSSTRFSYHAEMFGSHLFNQNWQRSCPKHKVTMCFNFNRNVGKGATCVASLIQRAGVLNIITSKRECCACIKDLTVSVSSLEQYSINGIMQRELHIGSIALVLMDK
jgi:hypothetical protein